MSQTNVERVREAWEGFMNGDDSDLSLFDADIVFEGDSVPEHAGEIFRGRDGLARSWAYWTESWESFTNELEWARAAGNSVVPSHRFRARARGSGIEVDTTYAYVWRFRGEKIIHLRAYRDVAGALLAVGLRS